MQFLRWLRIIGFGGFGGMVLSVIALWIDSLVRPDRNLLIFDLTLLVYLIFAVFGFIGGCVIGIVLLISRSRWVTFVAAVVVSLTMSWVLITSAIELYRDERYFDAPMFYADLLHIALILLIFPALGQMLWRFSGVRSRALIDGETL